VIRGWAATDQSVRKTIVVGTDGSPAGLPALEMAFDQAAARGVSVTVVHAWADGDLATVQVHQGFGSSAWPTVRKEAEVVLQRSVGDLRQKYPQVRVRPVVIRDRPAHGLLDHAQAAQLVVVGTHGRGGFAGMLLGSTCRKVLHSALCPVTVIPR
jgi:nucleotide-binding universal stress UspA family protein